MNEPLGIVNCLRPASGCLTQLQYDSPTVNSTALVDFVKVCRQDRSDCVAGVCAVSLLRHQTAKGYAGRPYPGIKVAGEPLHVREQIGELLLRHLEPGH